MLRHFCLSVTRVLCIKTAKHFVEVRLPPDSPIILVVRHGGSLLRPNSHSSTTNGAPNTEYKGVRELGDFWPISWCIWETLQDTAMVAIEVELESIDRSYQMVALSMSLSDRNPQFQGHPIVHATAGSMTSRGFFSDSWVKTCFDRQIIVSLRSTFWLIL